MSAPGDSRDSSNGATSPSAMPESEEKSRTCKGCLYYSSSLREARKNPICVGLARPEQRGEYAHVSIPGRVKQSIISPIFNIGMLGYPVRRPDATIFSDYERTASKEALELTEFKYACVGYSIHKEAAANQGVPLEGRELPLCFGIEFLADMANTRGQEAKSPSPLEQLEEDDGSSMQRPPSAVRQPSTIGSGTTGDEFASRFIRCAGLVASAVVKNVSHIATSVKTGFDDLVHDRRRPK